MSAPAKWGAVPPGRDVTRLEHMEFECDKVERYADHVATWKRGIEYILSLEPNL